MGFLIMYDLDNPRLLESSAGSLPARVPLDLGDPGDPAVDRNRCVGPTHAISFLIMYLSSRSLRLDGVTSSEDSRGLSRTPVQELYISMQGVWVVLWNILYIKELSTIYLKVFWDIKAESKKSPSLVVNRLAIQESVRILCSSDLLGLTVK